MDKFLLNYLEKHGVSYSIHKHQAVFTVKQSLELKTEMPDVLHTKNLFLKDESGSFYLVCMFAHNRLNLKELKLKLNVKGKLHFASAEELKSHLNVSPGSVSIFSAIYAKDLTLILDRKVIEAERTGFHPNINTATLELDKKNLSKFIDSLNIKKIIFESL